MGGRTLQGEETIAYSALTGDPGSGAVPAGEYNLLEDLKNQWEQLDGYSLEVSDGDLLAMANQGVSDLRSFSREMWNTHIGWGTSKPWTALGITRSQYVSTINSFAEQWQSLTGQQLDPHASPEQMPTKVWQALQGGETSAEFGTKLRNDQAMQKIYGWLKYGMDYNQFQQTKLQMRGAFARDLTDAEAIPQLQYWHTTQGANQSAQASPTFSQQEKRSAQVGPSGSVIR